MIYNLLIFIWLLLNSLVFLSWIGRLLLDDFVAVFDFASRFLQHNNEVIVILQLYIAVELCELLDTLIKRMVQLGNNYLVIFEETGNAFNFILVFHLLHEFCAILEVLVVLEFHAVFLFHFLIASIILQLLFFRLHVFHEVLQRRKMVGRLSRMTRIDLAFVHRVHQAAQGLVHRGALVSDHVVRLVELDVARLLVEVFDLVE